MNISVIIATYNRAPQIEACLRGLAIQAFVPGDEVIVVDNGSTDETSAILDREQASFPVPLRHLEEPRPGKSNAIAAGLAAARGEILAFTDDDVMVDAAWIETARRVMRESDAALAGGPVMPIWEAPPPSWLCGTVEDQGRLAAPLGLLGYGAEPLELGPRTALGGNLIVRRDVITRLGGFSPRLGKLRGTLLSGEDHELCQRVQAAGFRAVYRPEMRVSHRVPAERMCMRYSLAWFYWSGITHAILESETSGGGRSPQRALGHFARRAVTSSLRGVGAAVLGRRKPLMDHATDVAFAAGYLAAVAGAAT
jgi:glycosyltransferase involved in cell wall biosynthesis